MMKKSYALMASLCVSAAFAAVATAGDLTPAANAIGVSETTAQAPSCSTADGFCISTNDANANPSTGQSANPLAPITGVLPTQGIIAAGPSTQGSGTPIYYLFYDGNPTDSDPFGGYLGLNTADVNTALLGLVGSLFRTDNFNRAGGNNPIISLDALNQSMKGLSMVGNTTPTR